MNIYELLRMLLLGGFAGFVIFSISYGVVVWSRRNKGGGGKHALATIGSVLAVIGLAGLLSGVVQAKLATYTGLIESTINTSDRESRARLGALSTVPLKIDPALTLRQGQLRAQIDQLSRFQFDLETARRDIDREHTDLRSSYAREMATISGELDIAGTALAGYPERIALAEKQLQRAVELMQRGSFSEVAVDQRKLELLTLKDGHARTRATIAAARKREAIATEKFNQSVQMYETQLKDIDRRKSEYAESLNTQQAQLATVEKLIAEDGETALMVLSSGRGFVVKATVPATEIVALQQAQSITFEPRNIPIRSQFNGTFKDYALLEASPTMVMATFDVQLPSDILAQLKASNDPIQVDARWNPPIAQSHLVQASSGVTGLAFVLWLFGLLLGGRRRIAPTPEPVVINPAPVAIPATAVVRRLRP